MSQDGAHFRAKYERSVRQRPIQRVGSNEIREKQQPACGWIEDCRAERAIHLLGQGRTGPRIQTRQDRRRVRVLSIVVEVAMEKNVNGILLAELRPWLQHAQVRPADRPAPGFVDERLVLKSTNS